MQRICKLPNIVVTYWRRYGPLTEVLSRLCQETEIIGLPKTFEASECTTNVFIDISEELTTFATTFGKAFSPSRILCYYYLMKWPEQHDWQIAEQNCNITDVKTVESMLLKVKKLSEKYPQYSDLLQQLTNLLKELEQCISQSTTPSKD